MLAIARVIDPKRLSDRQHEMMANQLICASRASQSVARMRAKAKVGLTVGLVGTAMIVSFGSLGMAAWMWQTSGREVLLEHAKAKKPKANPN
jgi:hypothetical protein